MLDCVTASFQPARIAVPAVLIRRTLSLVGGLCCALLLWSVFSANPVCAVAVLLIAIVAFADPAAGLMVVLALSPLATTAVSTFWGTPGDWAEAVVLAAGLGWLLRQSVRGDHYRSGAGAPVLILACVGIASLVVQVAVLATKISPDLLAAEVVSSLSHYFTIRGQFTVVVRPVALLLEGLLVFTVAATPRPADANRRVLRMFAFGACGAAVLNLARLAGGALRSETPLAAALRLARTVRISLPYADVNAAGSYFLLAFFTAWGLLAAAGIRVRGGWAAAVAVLGAALWISGSRAALVAGVLAAMGLATLRGGRFRRFWRLGAVAATAILLVAVFPNPIADRTSLQAMSIRAEMARAATRLFATEPLFGIGVGQFFERSGEVIRDPSVRAIYARENAHNNFLQILAETGLVGFAAFLWLLAAAARSIVQALRNDADRTVLWGATAGLLGFLVTCLSGHPLLMTEVAVAFWGVLGTVVAAAPAAAAARSPLAGRVMTATAAAAVVMLAIGLPFRIARATDAVGLDHIGYRVTGWNFDRNGVRYRQMTSGATLFVPADAAMIELPYRLQWGREPVTLQLDFRGRTANRLVVSDHEWRTYRLVVPETGNGRHYLPLELTVLQGDESAVLLGKMSVHERKGVQ